MTAKPPTFSRRDYALASYKVTFSDAPFSFDVTPSAKLTLVSRRVIPVYIRISTDHFFLEQQFLIDIIFDSDL